MKPDLANLSGLQA